MIISPNGKQGKIFDIQRFSTQDGPGIRTTVFFKGCPLKCSWCTNPESQRPAPELFHLNSLCVECHKCVSVCPTGATYLDEDGSVKIDRNLCTVCGACVEACPANARVISGKTMSIDEVMKILVRDMLFYRNSGGGVTASGGEATVQADFLRTLFQRCQELGIHTALDTCGYVSWEVLEGILDQVELILYDIKHMDPRRHKDLTGVGNKLILENAQRIIQKEIPMIIRVPLIPGINDSEENIKDLGDFLVELGAPKIELLPYHQLGIKKYENLGLTYPLEHIKQFKKEQVEAIRARLASRQLDVKVI